MTPEFKPPDELTGVATEKDNSELVKLTARCVKELEDKWDGSQDALNISYPQVNNRVANALVTRAMSKGWNVTFTQKPPDYGAVDQRDSAPYTVFTFRKYERQTDL